VTAFLGVATPIRAPSSQDSTVWPFDGGRARPADHACDIRKPEMPPATRPGTPPVRPPVMRLVRPRAMPRGLPLRRVRLSPWPRLLAWALAPPSHSARTPRGAWRSAPAPRMPSVPVVPTAESRSPSLGSTPIPSVVFNPHPAPRWHGSTSPPKRTPAVCASGGTYILAESAPIVSARQHRATRSGLRSRRVSSSPPRRSPVWRAAPLPIAALF
jgi:hypothetical protein